MGGASDGSGSDGSEGTMDQRAKDQGAIEGAMGGASDVSWSYRRSDGRCERWIREQ